MARSRIIKPGFFNNKLLAECDPYARLLFIGLWTLADRDGRIRYTPLGLHGKLFEYDDEVNVGELLNELESRGFLVLYQTDSGFYLEIVNFSKHQPIHKDEKSNNYPSPNDMQKPGEKPEKNRTQPGEKPAPSTSSSTSTSTSKASASPPEKNSEPTKEEAELLAEAVKIAFAVDKPFRVIGWIYKNYPGLKERPNRVAWYLSRMMQRRQSDLEPLTNAYAYFTDMHQNRIVPAQSQGGDDNPWREEKTVAEYLNPLLGKGKYVSPRRGGGLTPLGDITGGA